ncbi:MAG: glycosyl hydrolase family 67 [bacterium]|nr:glycosyl hydrolase family 67 [bacterium]
MNERLYIIDSIGPFFVRHPREVINWSKAPHNSIEKKGVLPKKRGRRIRDNFESYTARAAAIGYNGVSIDELSRLAMADFYPAKLKRKIRRYRRYYRRLFEIAQAAGLKTYITTDVMFFNRWIEQETGGRRDKIFALLAAMLDELLKEFPQIAGVILRIGESDGVDVRGDFRSRLVIKTPADANELLRRLLPVFERRSRLLIFRTWTVGAYAIGDLMWNRRTYDEVFAGIESSRLIISMKYGESDFFRYLEVNRHFLLDGRPKLIELQSRREYEGFGEYPAFVGHEYAQIRDYLESESARGIVGIQVWCQTGGWSRFRNFTFLKNSSYWNELNTHVTLKLFRDRLSVEGAVASFLRESRNESEAAKETGGKSKGVAGRVQGVQQGVDPDRLAATMRFLELADQVIRELLYDPAFAGRALYMNRARVPPLLHVFWDSVTVNAIFRILHVSFVDPDEALKSTAAGYAALDKLKRMAKLARKAGVDYEQHRFQTDTFRLLAYGREVLYAGILPESAPRTKDLKDRLKKALKAYRRRYPRAYRFQIDPRLLDARQDSRMLNWLLPIFLRAILRKNREYRLRDRLLFHPALGWIYGGIIAVLQKSFPGFVNNQGMPLDKLLR